RSVANVAGFFSEDGAQQFFFGRERGFALRSHLAHENIAGTDSGADANHAAFIEVPEECLADVGDIASDLLGAELGVARLDFILFDVDGSVVVLFDQLFADQDGVFKVVTAPGQESHQHVAAKRELAAIGAGAVRQDLSLTHAISDADQGLLVDTSILVGALEFDQRVDVRADFAAEHAGMVGFNAHDDPLGVHLIDDAFAAADHYRAGIAGGNAFHAGADQRRFAVDQRYGLA